MLGGLTSISGCGGLSSTGGREVVSVPVGGVVSVVGWVLVSWVSGMLSVGVGSGGSKVQSLRRSIAASATTL